MVPWFHEYLSVESSVSASWRHTNRVGSIILLEDNCKVKGVEESKETSVKDASYSKSVGQTESYKKRMD